MDDEKKKIDFAKAWEQLRPDLALAKEAMTDPEPAGKLESAAGGLLKGGSWNSADEALAALGAASPFREDRTPLAKEVDEQGGDSRKMDPSLGKVSLEDAFRSDRDYYRQKFKDLEAANPKTFKTTELVGALASPLNKLLPGSQLPKTAPLLTKMASSGLRAMPAGAAMGFMGSDADMTKPFELSDSGDDLNVSQAVKDAAVGTALAGAAGAVLPGAAAGGKAVLDKAAPMTRDLASKLGSVTEPPSAPARIWGAAQQRAAQVLEARKAAVAQEQAKIAAAKAAPKGIQLPVDEATAKEAALITKMKRLGTYEQEGVPANLRGSVDLDNMSIEDAWKNPKVLGQLPTLRNMWTRISGKPGVDRGAAWQEKPLQRAAAEKPVDPGVPHEMSSESMLTDPKYVPEGIERAFNGKGRAVMQEMENRAAADPRFRPDYQPTATGYALPPAEQARADSWMKTWKNMTPDEIRAYEALVKGKK